MAQLVSDNFNSGSTLDATKWTVRGGAWNVATGNARSNGAGDNYVSYTGADWTAGADQWAKIKTVDVAGNEYGPTVRSAAGSETFYWCDVIPNAASQTHTIFKAPTFGTVGTWAQAIGAGIDVELDVQGTTLTALVAGVIKKTATDSAIASGLPGMMSPGAGNTMDDFAAGDFSLAVTNVLSVVGFHQSGPQTFGPGRRFVAQQLGFTSTAVSTVSVTLAPIVSAEQAQTPSPVQSGSVSNIASGENFQTIPGTMAAQSGGIVSAEAVQGVTFTRVCASGAAVPTSENFAVPTALSLGSVGNIGSGEQVANNTAAIVGSVGAVSSGEVVAMFSSAALTIVTLPVIASLEQFYPAAFVRSFSPSSAIPSAEKSSAPTSVQSSSLSVLPSGEVLFTFIAGATVTVSLPVIKSAEQFYPASFARAFTIGAAISSAEKFGATASVQSSSLGMVPSAGQVAPLVWTVPCSLSVLPSGEAFHPIITVQTLVTIDWGDAMWSALEMTAPFRGEEGQELWSARESQELFAGE